MPNQDKQYTIYLRSANLRVPCTKQQFDDYYRDINAYRRTQMNHGRCVCPPSKWLHCDMDCCKMRFPDGSFLGGGTVEHLSQGVRYIVNSGSSFAKVADCHVQFADFAH